MSKTDGERKNFCGKNIKKYREDRELSLEQCCNVLKQVGLTLSEHELHLIELGKQIVLDQEILYFCKALFITVEQLFEEDTSIINW